MVSVKPWKFVAGLCILAAAVWGIPACAQTSEVKEKPPLYSYVSNWSIPRAQWNDMEKAGSANQSIMQKAIGDGTIVAYGNDENLVHQPDGSTHDNFWSATSMAGLLNVLDQIYKSGSSTSPVLAASTRHWDIIYVSRYYNWHSAPGRGSIPTPRPTS